LENSNGFWNGLQIGWVGRWRVRLAIPYVEASSYWEHC
jgi:hypothetical protein